MKLLLCMLEKFWKQEKLRKYIVTRVIRILKLFLRVILLEKEKKLELYQSFQEIFQIHISNQRGVYLHQDVN